MKKQTGFTLIEIMIVVAVIGILAAIATGKFGDMIIRSKEAGVKGALGTLRSAINIYYSDNQDFPDDALLGLTANGKYLSDIPTAEIPSVKENGNPGHGVSNIIGLSEDDFASGAWVYKTADTERGHIYVNCSHTDTKGAIWSSY